MARLAWFSPMPPVRTGPAADSAALVAQLRAEHYIDVFVDEPVARVAPHTRSAHDFVWLHQQQPYDLTVYQLGNSSHHDYLWPYLFRYPGLTVLHDGHLHHARAATLLGSRRADDYRAEFAWNHPDADRDLAELAVAGFDNHLHYAWPMTRLVIRASRMVAVHSRPLADRLRAEVPEAAIEPIRLGHGLDLPPNQAENARAALRKRYAIDPGAIVFGCFGSLIPDKRIPQILGAFAATRAYVPSAHLLLAGGEAAHYDARGDVERHELIEHATLTGYIGSDEEFAAHVAACDVGLNLRWPTAREVSGPWLYCLAAGKPTVIIDLPHLVDVPSIDPRTWLPNANGQEARPITVAIDILDEDHSLRLAMRRLALDAHLRDDLGRAARDYWTRTHTIDGMVADYRQLIARALDAPAPAVELPRHLVDSGARTLEGLLAPFGLTSPLHPSGSGPLR
jgi:glycosyltransferase involved in cell wall biosynthesis